MNYLTFMERLLRLAVPNTGVWLAMFYLVFHLWLNILGELLLFGDRMFYKVCESFPEVWCRYEEKTVPTSCSRGS